MASRSHRRKRKRASSSPPPQDAQPQAPPPPGPPPPPSHPPPAALTLSLPPLPTRFAHPPLGKLQGKVVIQPRPLAKAHAQDYSKKRPADSTLAIFCDGAASDAYNVHNERYCSAAIAWKQEPDDPDWQARGCPLPPLECKTSTHAEVYALGATVRFFHVNYDALREQYDTLKVFTDAMTVLEKLDSLSATKGWPLGNQQYLWKFLYFDAELKNMSIVEYHWVTGHEKIPGNEVVDKMAAKCLPDILLPKRYPRPSERVVSAALIRWNERKKQVAIDEPEDAEQGESTGEAGGDGGDHGDQTEIQGPQDTEEGERAAKRLKTS